MTLTLFNDYPTTRSRYSPSNSPAAESLSQGSFIGARKALSEHNLWPQRAIRRAGPGPRPTDPGGESSRPFRHGDDSVSHERVFFFSMTSGPRPTMDPAADEWAQTPGLCRRELNV